MSLKRPRSKRLWSYMQAGMEEEIVVHGIDGVGGSSIQMCLVGNVGGFHEMPKTLHQMSLLKGQPTLLSPLCPPPPCGYMKANVRKSFEKLCHVPCGNELMCASAEPLVLAGRGGLSPRAPWPLSCAFPAASGAGSPLHPPHCTQLRK